MKQSITPESAMRAFVNCKKEGKDIPADVLESIKNYRKWGENSLIGLLNTSAYYPEIFLEENMEATINALLKKFKDRIVAHKF
jgi:hypothetical protein